MLNRTMLLAGIAGMALLAGPALQAAGGDPGDCHGTYDEGCWSGEGVRMEECGDRHSMMMGLGRYDLSEEDRERIDAIIEEARAEIEDILADYEPAGEYRSGAGCRGY